MQSQLQFKRCFFYYQITKMTEMKCVRTYFRFMKQKLGQKYLKVLKKGILYEIPEKLYLFESGT